MKRILAFALLASSIPLSLDASGPRPPAPTLTFVQVRGGSLAWAGLLLGDKRGLVEETLGTAVRIEAGPKGSPCPYRSVVTREGHTVSLRWSDDGPEALLQSMSVPLTPREGKRGSLGLAEDLRRRVPGLKLLWTKRDGKPPTSRFAFVPEGNDKHQVLLKVGGENLVVLAVTTCLD